MMVEEVLEELVSQRYERLVNLFTRIRSRIGLTKKAININNLIRDEYNELTEREESRKLHLI